MTSPSIARPNTQRTDRTFMQRQAEAALTPHPFRVEVRGKPGLLAWSSARTSRRMLIGFAAAAAVGAAVWLFVVLGP